jgi:monovalent cation:H+ antiporter-2, CPA2 family
MESTFLLQVTVFMIAAIICVPLAKRLGMGSVIGYLAAGILIGPFVLGFVGNEGDDIMHIAEFGVVMMLFLIGLDLEPARLWKLRKTILGTGLTQVILTMVLVAALSYAIGMPWQGSLAIGMSFALSSTAIVLQSFKETGRLDTEGGRNSFSILLFQDIAVVPILALLPLLAFSPMGYSEGEEVSVFDWLPAWLQGLAILFTLVSIFFIGRIVVPWLLKLVSKTHLRELFTAAALLIVVGVALLTSLVGLSPALGTFLAGVILANSPFRHELESDLEPFKGLLLGLFFMAVGASVNFNLIAENPITIVGITGGIIILKGAILFTLGRIMKMSVDQNMLMTLSLSQVGEFAFVTLAFTGQLRIVSQEITGILMAVVALSMVVTPLLLLINDKFILSRFNKKERDSRQADEIEEKNSVIIAGFSHFGSTLGRFLRANGINATILDFDPDRVDLLRRMGFKVYYGDATRRDLLESAGAADASILISAIDSPEVNLKLVEIAQKHFPHLDLMIRTKNRYDAYDLMHHNITNIYRENLDTSVRMGVDVLKKLGKRAYSVYRSGQQFMKYDEESMKELYKLKHDENLYISATRHQIEMQEDLLRNDLKQKPNLDDHAWDSDELKKGARGE